MKINPSDLDWKGAHEVMLGAIVPRPIAFVSTIGADGVFNVAPFSCFAPICHKPVLVGFSISTKRDGQRKDTIVNIEATGEFVINVVDEALAEVMNRTSYPYPPEVDEFQECRLTPVKADMVKVPMVGESPINMECRVFQILEFGEPSRRTSFVIGEVIRVHIEDALYLDGEIRMTEMRPIISRMGGEFYCRTTDLFEMERPYTLA